MNVFRRITIKRATKSYNISIATRERVENSLSSLWTGHIIGFGIFGAGYGFYESIQDSEYERNKLKKIGYITGMTLFMGLAGIIGGFTSPITLPIAIPAYAYLTYQERKKE